MTAAHKAEGGKLAGRTLGFHGCTCTSCPDSCSLAPSTRCSSTTTPTQKPGATSAQVCAHSSTQEMGWCWYLVSMACGAQLPWTMPVHKSIGVQHLTHWPSLLTSYNALLHLLTDRSLCLLYFASQAETSHLSQGQAEPPAVPASSICMLRLQPKLIAVVSTP